MISSEIPDWSREDKNFLEWCPSKSLLASIRKYEKASLLNTPIAKLNQKLAIYQHCIWSVITGADIPITCNIGGGLLLPHPNGVVIHPDAKIGPNCLILQQVTIGTLDGVATPTIGGQVDIGAGAKVLGDITLGNHARVGANAVVLIDIPKDKTAVGIPAKVI